jgi:hypothetical protein
LANSYWAAQAGPVEVMNQQSERKNGKISARGHSFVEIVLLTPLVLRKAIGN